MAGMAVAVGLGVAVLVGVGEAFAIEPLEELPITVTAEVWA
jgi:hypothetical protein